MTASSARAKPKEYLHCDHTSQHVKDFPSVPLSKTDPWRMDVCSNTTQEIDKIIMKQTFPHFKHYGKK